MGRQIKDKRIEAYNRIKRYILTNHFGPGQQLGHEYLRKIIGVSTTPIREALNRLAEDGYIVHIKNRGYFVSDLHSKELENLYEIREALEMFAMEKTMRDGRRINKALRNSLQRTMDLYWQYAHEQPHRYRLHLDRRFHVALAKLCGNQDLCTMLDSTFEKVNYKRKLVELYAQGGSKGAEEHYRIVDLLLAGKGDTLLKLLQNHIQRAKERVLSILRARETYMKSES
jgi:DNA-binding GntR family transcriptional regulator